MKPNERASVDAGFPTLLAFERAWSGTTQRKRWTISIPLNRRQ